MFVFFFLAVATQKPQTLMFQNHVTASPMMKEMKFLVRMMMNKKILRITVKVMNSLVKTKATDHHF